MTLSIEQLIEHIDADLYPFNRDKDYKKWVDSRFDFVGSSTIASILGLVPYPDASPLARYNQYRKRKSTYSENDYTYAGLAFEEHIQALAERQHSQYKIIPYNVSHISREYPWASGTPDGIVIKTTRPDWGVNETKFTSAKKDLDTWLSGSIPAYVYAQTQWQMGVCNLKWGLITAMVLGNVRIKVKEIEFDPELFDGMVERAKQFLDSVKNETPPKARGTAEDTRIINSMTEVTTGVTKTVTEPKESDTLKALHDITVNIKTISAELSPLKVQKKELENAVKGFADKSQIITDGSYQVKLTKVNVSEQTKKAHSYYTVTSKRIAE